MLCGELIALYHDTHAKHNNKLCGQNAELMFKQYCAVRDSCIVTLTGGLQFQ
jgi:hypothetical protein